MVYNSDNYVIVQFDVPTDAAVGGEGGLTRGGYEIVDKSARKEMFIEGAMAASFREGVEALILTSPSEEELDDYIGRFTALMQQPVILH
jgi:hypothetical protein